MTEKPSVFHPAGIAIGALLTGIGLVLAETVLGPLLVRRSIPVEEALLANIHRSLMNEYVVPLNDQDARHLMHRGIDGMLASLNDDYTFFIDSGAELTKLEEESSGQLIGIGAVIQDNGYVRYPRPGGPSEVAGLRPGDRFLLIDDEDVSSYTSDQLIPLLKGEAGTTVELAMERPDGSRYEAEVVRTAMPTITVRRPRIVDEEFGVGVVHVASFAHSTPTELDAALDSLERQGMRAIVLDLRFNPGGMLPSAVSIAARFMHGGKVVTLKARSGTVEPRMADPAVGRFTHLPVVVLLNRLSASGSEVVGGALRDLGHAVIVGERSYGKGVFQQVRRYDQHEFAMKFAAGYFVTPSGRVIEGHLDPDRAGGLEPDVHVPGYSELTTNFVNALRYEAPPEEYREAVMEHFPQTTQIEWPADPTLDTAVALLRSALSEV